MELEQNTDPFALFGQWFEEAVASEINDPDAIALASVDRNGMPSVRMVLLKQWSPDGFVFYTNYESRKSDRLLATEKAAFCMHWKSLRRRCVSSARSRRYRRRNPTPILTPVGVAARSVPGPQHESQPLASRAELAAAVVRERSPFSRCRAATTSLGWLLHCTAGNRILG